MGTGKSGFGGGGGPDNRNWMDAAKDGKIDGYYELPMGSSHHDVDVFMGNVEGGSSKDWYEGLSKEEKAALDFYTRNGSSDINGIARGTDDADEWNRERAEKSIENLDAALSKYELKQPTIVHRKDMGDFLYGGDPYGEGGRDTNDVSQHINLSDVKKMIGKEITDPGYLSTTVKPGRIGAFDDYVVGGDNLVIQYHIKTPAGKGIGGYIGNNTSNGHSESEFLFARGSKFKVLGGYEEITRPNTPVAERNLHVNLEYVGKKKGAK